MFIIFSRHADVTGNEPNIFSGECVACCLERSGVLSSTVEIDREREDISAHLQTEGKVIVEVNSNTHQLIKCWLKAMEIDHNDCKIDFYDLLDEVVTDLKYKPFLTIWITNVMTKYSVTKRKGRTMEETHRVFCQCFQVSQNFPVTSIK